MHTSTRPHSTCSHFSSLLMTQTRKQDQQKRQQAHYSDNEYTSNSIQSTSSPKLSSFFFVLIFYPRTQLLQSFSCWQSHHNILKEQMQFDILNELITSTVYDLFTNTEKIALECKPKVKELEGLIKQENNIRRNSSTSSHNDSFSVLSEGSARESSASKPEPPRYKTVAEWMEKQSGKRLKEAFKKLGLDESLMKSTRKVDLEQYIETMSVDGLANEKKKVKNELKSYDSDFSANFKRQPNHDEKEPLRPLYVYYKKLKESLTRRGGQEMSQQKIEGVIANIKKERRELREKIEAYQNQFQQNNNRKIRYVKDIAPIDAQYRRYKELKVDLQKYEEMLNK